MANPRPDVPAGRIVLAGADAVLVGAASVVTRPLLGLFCSVRCAAEVIRASDGLACALREAGVAVVSGFHSPGERACLSVLLRGTQPLVICPARGLAGMPIPSNWQAPLLAGRLALVAPYPDSAVDRPTADLAARRNAFVARVATRLLILHASPGGRIEALCRDALRVGKPVYALADAHNAHLFTLGAKALTSDEVGTLL